MTDRKSKQNAASAMCHSLSGLSCDNLLAQRVLIRAKKDKGEKKVLKRMSGGFIFTIIITLLLVTTALALTNWEQLQAYFTT